MSKKIDSPISELIKTRNSFKTGSQRINTFSSGNQFNKVNFFSGYTTRLYATTSIYHGRSNGNSEGNLPNGVWKRNVPLSLNGGRDGFSYVAVLAFFLEHSVEMCEKGTKERNGEMP